MKRILITGKNSYIGNCFKKWLYNNYPKNYDVDTISLREKSWKKEIFSKYDVVIHVSGIAHIKETKENAELYYQINRDLAYEAAKKAKNEGVKQFVFLSSMSIYGMESGVIDRNTIPRPKSNYGKSKLQAEKKISNLEDASYRVAIIRPPMIYGKGCKGNYQKLAKLALRTPVFPNINNRRSMIYVDNLSEFVRLLIDNQRSGIFLPQNNEYITTSEMVRLIAKSHNKNIKTTKLLNVIMLFSKNSIVNKVFGDLVYEKDISFDINNYNIYNFRESIEKTEL